MKLKADGVGYEMPESMTMGELRLLKRRYDLARPDEMDHRNIDHMAGLLHIAIQRAHPNLPADMVEERVDNVKRLDVEDDPEPATEPERPTVPATADQEAEQPTTAGS